MGSFGPPPPPPPFRFLGAFLVWGKIPVYSTFSGRWAGGWGGEPCWTPVGSLNGTRQPQAAWVAAESVRFGIVKASVKKWAGLGYRGTRVLASLFRCALRRGAETPPMDGEGRVRRVNWGPVPAFGKKRSSRGLQ